WFPWATEYPCQLRSAPCGLPLKWNSRVCVPESVFTAFLCFCGYRQLQDMVQGGDLALDAAASFQIKERIAVGCKNVSGAHDIRAPKENDAVSVSVRFRLVVDDDRFTVEVQILGRGEIFIGRQSSLEAGQPVQHILMS